MKNLIKILFFLTLILSFEKILAKDYEYISDVYNQSARIDVKGENDVYVTAGYLLWKVHQDNMDLGEIREDNQRDRKVVKLKSDFQSGFKVAVGMSFPQNNLLFNIEYNSIYTRNSKRVLNDNTIFLYWNAQADLIDGIEAVWKVDYDIVDITLSYPIYISRALSFSPFLGLIVGSLDQKADISYLPGEEFHYKSKSWLAGPILKGDLNWLFPNNFRLFSKTAISIFYQKSSKPQMQFNPPGNTSIFYDNTKSWVPFTQIGLGIGHGNYTDDNKLHYDITLSYDVLYYWNQNYMYFVESSDIDNSMNWIAGNGSQGDLKFHGLTAAIRFDF